jgi:hypothetical protein
MRTRQRETDEKTRLAVEMYTRDQEALHHRLAAEAAMEEVQVPPDYLRRAEEEILHRQSRRKQRWQALAVAAVCLVPAAGVLAFVLNRPPSTPIVESFSESPHQKWSLDLNQGSKGTVEFAEGRATIKVDWFAPGEDGRYWATLRSVDGDKNLRTLNKLSFRARGEGLTHVRFRFVNGSKSWVTPSYEIRPEWRAFTVPLNQLDQFKKKRDKETSDGAFDDRPNSSVSEIQIQTGVHVNPSDAKGTVEIDDLDIR